MLRPSYSIETSEEPAERAEPGFMEELSAGLCSLCLILGAMAFGLTLGALYAFPSTQIQWRNLGIFDSLSTLAFCMGCWKFFRILRVRMKILEN